MEKPKLLINDKAKKKIKSLLKRIENEDIIYTSCIDLNIIREWTLINDCNVKCYILSENEIEKSFILLRDCEFDPLKELTNEHTKPKLISYIYTFSDYRRNNLAYKLLLHVKKYDETTAFCSSDKSIKLFEKADFKLLDCDRQLPAHRYPH